MLNSTFITNLRRYSSPPPSWRPPTSPPQISLSFNTSNIAADFDDVVENVNDHLDMVMHLITLLASSTSLVMLCFSIITYSLFSDMRDLAGLVMLNASVALFFCQLLLLMGIDRVVEPHIVLCNAITMLMHLFWLATLLWFVIGIYDLAQDFRTRLAPSVAGTTLRDTLIAYCVAGWGIPLGVVFVCTLLQHSNTVQYLHHRRQRCWFPDTSGVAYGLLLPFVLAMPVVLLCMRQTWLNIELTSRLSKMAGVVKRWKKPDAIMFELYIKIFCLAAVVWMLCFIAGVGLFEGVGAPWARGVHRFLWYAFEICLAMFGTVVSLLFTCNGAVFKAYASGRSKRSRRHSSIVTTGDAAFSSSVSTMATSNNTLSSVSAAAALAASTMNLATIHESWSGERLMEAALAADEELLGGCRSQPQYSIEIV